MSDDKTANPTNISPDDLTKTKVSGQPELQEQELDKVSGGAPAVEYLKIKMTDVLISG